MCSSSGYGTTGIIVGSTGGLVTEVSWSVAIDPCAAANIDNSTPTAPGSRAPDDRLSTRPTFPLPRLPLSVATCAALRRRWATFARRAWDWTSADRSARSASLQFVPDFRCHASRNRALPMHRRQPYAPPAMHHVSEMLGDSGTLPLHPASFTRWTLLERDPLSQADAFCLTTTRYDKPFSSDSVGIHFNHSWRPLFGDSRQVHRWWFFGHSV